VGNQTYTLDAIEHEILRKKYKDPRIHVGVNCASISCPKLSNIAFTEENIATELEKLMKGFVNDATKNKITDKNLKISKIFTWFKEDFTEKGSIIEFLNQYSDIQISKNAKIRYANYDWNLNER
jgi:ribosomal protein L22